MSGHNQGVFSSDSMAHHPRRGSLSALQTQTMRSTQMPSSSASKNNLLVHNNELVSEIVSLREALRRRNKEIGLLRLELLRQYTPIPQDSSPEKKENEKREVSDASTQTEAAADHHLLVVHPHREEVSPERNNKMAAMPPSSKVQNSPERLHSPIRRRESAVAAAVPVKSPLPRGSRGKLFKGMDSLQLLSTAMATICERDDVDESMIV
jgi:hypothetical protein